MIYLIDFENVHEEGFSALGRLGDKDAVYCFFTRNVAKISMSALAGMRSGQLHFIEAESGKQSLDLALVSYLGYLIGTRPQELYYDIVSNDNGFAKVAEFWNKRGNGLRVRIRKTTDLKPKAEPVKPQPAVNPQRHAQLQKVMAEQSVPAAESAEPTLAPAMAEEIAAKTEQAAVAVASVEAKQESGRSGQNKTRGRQRSQRQRAAKQEQQANAAAVVAPVSAVVTVPSAEAAPVVEVVPVQVTAVTDKESSEAMPAEPKSAEKQAEKNAAEPKPLEKKQEKKPAEPKPVAKQPEAKPAEPVKPKAEAKPLDAATVAALEAAGINAAAAEFIQSQAEKYRSDKNMKQLVYRAMVKKYGQKTGTQIYNSAKKLLLK